jgi:NAD(P)-dependent dehydrogenase (short-subunit alcohol dehydrogenase family)
MGRLSGKVAAVTGGASGIGEATARLFAEEGARVALADVDADRGRAVADDIQTKGGSALFVETHTEREAEAGAFIRRARDQFGRLDVLVNNAGMRLYQTVVDASEESWDAILAVNVKGYAFCAKAAIPEMRLAGGGSIVNVASIRAVVAGGNMVQYDATKAAVAGLTRAMAFDHAREGIRVNAVCPGPIFTRFHERRAAAAGKSFEDFKGEFGRGTMLKRPGTPREVAACILFLASEDASYVTGTCLFVDGGQTAM